MTGALLRDAHKKRVPASLPPRVRFAFIPQGLFPAQSSDGPSGSNPSDSLLIFHAHLERGPVNQVHPEPRSPRLRAHGPCLSSLPPGLALRQGFYERQVRFWYGNGLCLMSDWFMNPTIRTPPERPARHKLSQSRTWGGRVAGFLEHVKNIFCYWLDAHAVVHSKPPRGMV